MKRAAKAATKAKSATRVARGIASTSAGKQVAKTANVSTKKTAKKAAKKTAAPKSLAKKPAARKSVAKKSSASAAPSNNQSPQQQADAIVAWLKKNAHKPTLDGMARYGLPSDKAFGVPINVMLKEGKRLGRNHDVAMALWNTGWYEARLMATYLGQPEVMTSAEMDKWCAESDNWGICDTAGWHVYERSPFAWAKIEKWGKQKGEFQKRSSLALLATLALHDKTTGDAPFSKLLPLVEQSAHDDRNFVFKGANWALRSIGLRSTALQKSCLQIAQRLSESPNAGARWAGKDALRKLAMTVPRKRTA